MELLALAMILAIPLWVAYWFFKLFGDLLIGLFWTVVFIWFFLWLII